MNIKNEDIVRVLPSLARDNEVSPYLHAFVGRTSRVVRIYQQYAELDASMGNMMFPLRHLKVTQQAMPGKAAVTLNTFRDECHEAAHQWWHDDNGDRIERNKGELLCLIHSEISEAMEGERKGQMDDHLPHRPMAEVELADTLIRIFDYAGAFGYDLDGAYREKLAYNRQRADHKRSNRGKVGGKKF